MDMKLRFKQNPTGICLCSWAIQHIYWLLTMETSMLIKYIGKREDKFLTESSNMLNKAVSTQNAL